MAKLNKYTLIFIVFFVAMIMIISSCSYLNYYLEDKNKDAVLLPEDKTITLKLWHVWPTYDDANKRPLEKVINEWNNINPNIKIEAKATENEAYKLKIRTAVAVNEMPDIFYTWGAGFAKPFVEANKVLPLDEYLNDGTKDRITRGTLDYFTYDGKIYGLPIYLICGVLYCNEEIFERFNQPFPETFDQMLAQIKIFKSGGVIPMTVGEKDGWPGMFYQNILAIRTAGVELTNSALNNKAEFDRPEFVESARALQQMIKAGAFDPRCMNLTRNESEQDFKNGKVAMYYNGNWVAGSLDGDDSPVKGKIVAINFPGIENAKGDPNALLGGAIDTFMVSASTKYKEEAVKALKYVDENLCKESYLSGASEPAWKINLDNSESGLRSNIANLLKNSTGFVLAWDTILSSAEAEKHINLVAGIFEGKITPEEFASQMQEINKEKTAEK